MQWSKKRCAAALAVVASAFGVASMQSATSVAQEAHAKPSVGQMLRHNIATKVATITIETTRGEPEVKTATVDFDRDVEAYWIAVVGQDVKFRGTTEKQINRVMVAVDPYAKIVNGKTVEVSGKLGIRDGSGTFDDSYEGTITVAVTAVLAN
jgi:hypothetical protein